MRVYFADTNFILRFLLQDVKEQHKKTTEVFEKVAAGKSKVKLISETVIETEYVFRKVYKISKKEIANKMLQLLRSGLVEVEKKGILIKSFEKYKSVNIDLVDILLFYQAKEENGEVLTFDRDFKKLKK